MKTKLFKTGLIFFMSITLAGCTFIFQKGRRSDAQKIEELSHQLDQLSQAKMLLENSLSKEIKDKEVRLEMMEKGLVVTVVGDVLFDSGKANIREQSFAILDKVATVLKDNVPKLSVGIEGHTDNVPIKVSGWKSNWELSSARALSVLHYLVDQRKIFPKRLSAIGFGQYAPVASNGNAQGRQLNRRVEIVILPQLAKESGKTNRVGLAEPEENLK
ncbi:MAG: OmpA family protein [Candidatus Omnitrophota bacterium]